MYEVGAVYIHFGYFTALIPLKIANWKYFFIQSSPISKRALFFWKVPRLLSFVLLVRATCVWRWTWCVRAMIMTGENRSAQRKPCSTVTLDNHETDLDSPGIEIWPLLWEAGDCPPETLQARLLKTEINLTYVRVYRLSSYRAVNTHHLGYKNQSLNAACCKNLAELSNTLWKNPEVLVLSWWCI